MRTKCIELLLSTAFNLVLDQQPHSLRSQAMAAMSSRETSVDEQALLPRLPDDVALHCLLRVPFQSLPHLQRVCKRWRDLITSTEFHNHRTKHHSLCLLEALPARNHPLFRISLLNTTDPLPQPPDSGVPLFARLATTGNLLLLLGGWHPITMAARRSVLIFNFSSRTWLRGADMPRSRSFFACTTLRGNVIVAGGHDPAKNALRSADIYNASDDSWSALPDMAIARDECTSAVLDVKLVVLGGYTTFLQGQFRSDLETCDAERNSWIQHSIHSSKSSLSHMVAAAGKLVAFRDGEVVCYSAKGNSWHVVDALPDAIASVSSAAGFGDGIFVTGECGDGGHRVFVYRLRSELEGVDRCKGRWETVSADGRLGGVVHGSCVVEV